MVCPVYFNCQVAKAGEGLHVDTTAQLLWCE